MTTHTHTRTKGRWQLLGIASLFIVPLLLAWLWYQNNEVWQPDLGANHGVLIEPIVPLAPFELNTTTGSLNSTELQHRWTLVLIVPANCAADCQQNLYHSRQIRLALGKDSPRVQRLMLTPLGGTDLEADWLANEHPDLLLAEGGNLQTQIETAKPALAATQGYYLVDPLLNLMMYFPHELDPKAVLEDLKRLLRISRIG